jgi:hypothetical protein
LDRYVEHSTEQINQIFRTSWGEQPLELDM